MSGYTGVSWEKRKKKPWKAQIRQGGKFKFLGFYTSKKAAAKAWDDAVAFARSRAAST